MTTVADCRRVWECAVADPDKASLEAVALGLGVVALLGGLLGALMAREVVAGFLGGAGFPLCCLALYAWSRFLPGAARQIGALHSGMVPRLNRRVRLTVLLAWVVTMLPFLAMAYVVQDRLLFVAGCVVAVTAFGLYQLGRNAFLVCALAAYLVLKYVDSELFMAASPYRAVVMSALLAASLAFAAYALISAFPRVGRPDGKTDVARLASVQAVLSRRHGQALGRHMLLHALGPVKTWGAFMLPFVAALLAIVAARYAMTSFEVPFDLSGRMLAMAGAGIATAMVYGWSRYRSAMWRTPVEQSLVRLTPGAPPASQFNRILATQLLQASLREWVMYAAFGTAVIALWSAKPAAYLMTAGLMVTTFTCVGMALGDYASRLAFSSLMVELGGASAVIFFLISLAFLDDPVTWACLTLVNLGASLLVLRARWKAMLAAPVVFPAGRMA